MTGLRAATREKAKAALSLRLQGHTYRYIAGVLGTSRQWIQQLLAPDGATRARVISEAGGKCAGCGIHATGGHIHLRGARGLELDRWGDRDKLDLLCPACHRSAHFPRGRSDV